MVLILVGCLQSVNGVLVDEEEKTRLYRAEGPPLNLVLDDHSALLEHLHDCTVELDGLKLGRRYRVDDWRVLAAGDGSAPFIGVIRRDGDRLLLQDHNSGATYVLTGQDELGAFEGRPLMVIGFVTGPQVIQVMGWRVLDDA